MEKDYRYEIYNFRSIPNIKDETWPEERSGHRAIASNNKVWILGGYNPKNFAQEGTPLYREVWMYDKWLHKWKKLKKHDEIPSTLASQAVIRHHDYMIAMGGTGYPFGLDKSSNDITVCNLKTEDWKMIETTGEKPEKVYGQAMAIHENDLFVFGGTSGFEYNSSLHVLDMKTLNWKYIKPKTEVEPEPRYRHEMVLFDHHLYVIGGGTSSRAFGLQTVWVYSIKDNVWCEKPTIKDQIGFPHKRRCHSCVLYKDKAFICGGYDSHSVCADLWQLHLPTLQWRFLSEMKDALYFHSAAVTTEGCMYVFGGVTVGEHRNNSLHRVWLDIPSLATLCADALIRRNPKVLEMSQKELYDHNITPMLSMYTNGPNGG